MSERMPTHEIIPTESDQAFERLRSEREAFVSEMVATKAISLEFALSGILDEFGILPETNHDALIHTLVGGAGGGAHCLEALHRLERDNVEIGSRIAVSDHNGYRLDPEASSLQGYMEDGRLSYTVRAVRHTIDGKVYVKKGATTMFPNEWSTEKVINAISTVASQPVTGVHARWGSFIHEGEVDGERIRVVRSRLELGGKIETAHPVKRPVKL